MKIFITGANGFIGTHLKTFLSRNNEVISFTREQQDLTIPIPYFDIDVIIHLAGGMPYENVSNIISNNILVTYNVAEFAKKQKKLKHFIYFSTYLVYGYGTSNEDTPCIPDNIYSICKISCEKILEISKLPLTILRMTSVYGPGQNSNTFISKCLKNIRDGEILNISDCETSYVSVFDVCNLIQILLNKGPSDMINVVGEKINNISLAKNISEIIGKPLLYNATNGYTRNIESNKLKYLNWSPVYRLKDQLEDAPHKNKK
jgi:nucleoside-diphosphate-sugar epimerase